MAFVYSFGETTLALYSIKVNSYLGSDTRIQVVKDGNPKKESYLDRNPENETTNKTHSGRSRDASDRPVRSARVRRSRLTAHGKATLQRIGGCVSHNTPAEFSLFLTGTFPGKTFAAQSAIADQSAWIVHRLKAWIYKRVGPNIGYYVWEFQKRGTLHLHYVVVIPNKDDRNWIEREFRDEWIRLIAGASARSSCDLFIGERGRNFFTEKEKLQIYAQECYKNCSSYLSKYLAKGKFRNFPPPVRMWGCTKEARNAVASSLIRLEICHKVISDAEEIAYALERESDTPNDKRRFFRHRFSQGFTILLYNDSYRMLLSEMKEQMVNRRKIGYLEKINTLWAQIKRAGVQEKLRDVMSKGGWNDLMTLVYPDPEKNKPLTKQEVKAAMLEVRACMYEHGLGSYTFRGSANEKIAVIVLEVSEND